MLLPHGERPRCLEVCPYHEERAANCPVEACGGYFTCWTVRGMAYRLETGAWLRICLECPVYRSADLAPYFCRAGTS